MTVCKSQCIAKVATSAPKPNLNWNAADSDTCQQLTDETACKGKTTCEWKSPCQRGACPLTFPPTVHLATSSPDDSVNGPQGSHAYVWAEGAGPASKDGKPQTTYEGCQTATPALCHTLATQAEAADDDAPHGADEPESAANRFRRHLLPDNQRLPLFVQSWSRGE